MKAKTRKIVLTAVFVVALFGILSLLYKPPKGKKEPFYGIKDDMRKAFDNNMSNVRMTSGGPSSSKVGSSAYTTGNSISFR